MPAEIELAEELAVVKSDVKGLLHFHDGNGQPGAPVRLDRIERILSRIEKIVWPLIIATALGVLRLLGDTIGVHLGK